MATRRSRTEADYAQRMSRVQVFIQQHLDRVLPLEELAQVADFSPFHFHRIFRGVVGESVKQHVRRLRLERAAGQLKSGSRRIIEVALGAGYETHESFTRAFSAAFGCPPSDFRLAARGSRLPAPAQVHLPMQIDVRRLEARPILFLRHVGPYDQVGETWERLCDWAGQQGLVGAQTEFFGASYDDPEVTPADKLRYEACITVPPSTRGEGEFGVRTQPAGDFAVALHEGPYSGLNQTYAGIFGGWFASCGREPGPAPCLEFYLNEPETTDPEDLLTEVHVPILSR
jgi:AraC family transcriptional regulator